MTDFRCIVSSPADGPGNMAADEALFNSVCGKESPSLAIRLYAWRYPSVTIGYFQKYDEVDAGGLHVTRRLTGGLAVYHGSDLSYGLACNQGAFPYVYDQQKAYQVIHEVIAGSLRDLNISAQFYPAHEAGAAERTSLCVKSIFPHDLGMDGRKILGSCQRRRGGNLLQQGSIHVAVGMEAFSEAFARSWKTVLQSELRQCALTVGETEDAQRLIGEKYGDERWNRKF